MVNAVRWRGWLIWLKRFGSRKSSPRYMGHLKMVEMLLVIIQTEIVLLALIKRWLSRLITHLCLRYRCQWTGLPILLIISSSWRRWMTFKQMKYSKLLISYTQEKQRSKKIRISSVIIIWTHQMRVVSASTDQSQLLTAKILKKWV